MIDKLGILERFKAVVEHGSVRRAADVLNLSQPALSRSIRLIEEDFGTALFTREARGLVLTAFGERVYSVASRLARDWEMSRAALLGDGVEYEGTMRVSAGPVWTAVVLPTVVPQLNARFPRLRLEVERVDAAAIADWLKSGHVDVCLGVRPETGLPAGEFETVALDVIRDRVLARAGHPIHDADPADFDALHRYPWIVYTEIPTYAAETHHVVRERTGRVPTIAAATSSLALFLRLMNGGDYLCFLADAFTRVSPWPLRVVPMDIGRGAYRTGATFRRTHVHFEPLMVLVDLCRAHFGERAALPAVE
jgi:DNA-binding transcriptional LysR family regulator